MRVSLKNRKGFTLIEVIVSLLIVSVMAAVAGMGIVEMTNAFIFAKDSNALAQKNQLAMTRLRMSLQNLTSISAAGSDTITMTRRSPNGTLITETFQLSGGELQVRSSDFTPGNFYTLADDVSSLTLSYLDGSGNTWSSSDRLSDLSRIGISISFGASEGTDMTYVDEVLPANVYVPQGFSGVSFPSGTTGTSTVSCFMDTVGFENGTVLNYIGYCKKHIIMVLLLGGILLVFLRRYRVLKGVKLPSVSGKAGSILIGVVVTMVIVAILGSAMVTLFSSSSTGTVRFAYAQKAQYLARSGLNYALSRVAVHRDSNLNILRQDLVDSLFLGQAFPVGNDSFTLSASVNWLEESSVANSTTGSLVATAPGGMGIGSLPGDFLAGSDSGELSIAVSGGIGSTYQTVSYDSYSVGGGSVTFTLNPAATAPPEDNASVYPVARVNGNQTISPVSIGSESSSDLNISGNLSILPGVQGTFIASTADGVEVFLQYDYLDRANSRLVGLHCPPGVSDFTGVLNDDAVMVFNEFATFTSTGTVSMGSDSVSRSMTLFQPMTAVQLYRTIEGQMTAGDVRSVIGLHEGVEIDGDTAIKVSQTEMVISAFIPEDVYMQESLGVMNWGTDPNPLETLWEGSTNKLRYDLQTKIRFTDAEDDLSESEPLNHPGNYMPGVSFRVKGPLGGSSSDYSYYGFSIMRGIEGRSDHTVGSGCDEEIYYTEDDDIPDTFYEDHGSTTVADTIECEGFQENNWDDTPPLDGIPCLILWQKDATGYSSGCDTYSPWERMAYAPLLDHEEVYVHYETVWDGSQNVEVVYEGSSGGEPILVWKLTDKYNLFKTYDVEGITVLGLPGAEVVRDPATKTEEDPVGKPVAGGANGPVGYIRPPGCDEEDDSQQCRTNKAIYNYRIYPKEWITLMVNIYETIPACQPDRRVNVIVAYFASPGTDVGSSFGNVSSTDLNRKKLDRGTIKWPDQGDYFTQVVWGRGLDDEKKGYSSETFVYAAIGCAEAVHKLVEIGYDGAGDPTMVYSPTFTTEDYNFYTQDIPEFGAHTLGINASATLSAEERETAYFDDFAWRFTQGTGAVVAFPGITTQ